MSAELARERLALFGASKLNGEKRSNSISLLVSQFKRPIILILFFATGLPFILNDPVGAEIILSIVQIRAKATRDNLG